LDQEDHQKRDTDGDVSLAGGAAGSLAVGESVLFTQTESLPGLAEARLAHGTLWLGAADARVTAALWFTPCAAALSLFTPLWTLRHGQRGREVASIRRSCGRRRGNLVARSGSSARQQWEQGARNEYGQEESPSDLHRSSVPLPGVPNAATSRGSRGQLARTHPRGRSRGPFRRGSRRWAPGRILACWTQATVRRAHGRARSARVGDRGTR
jgi:hypothetical protein